MLTQAFMRNANAGKPMLSILFTSLRGLGDDSIWWGFMLLWYSSEPCNYVGTL